MLPPDLPLYGSLLTFAALLWKASAVSTEMKASLEVLRTTVGETKAELAKLTSITERIALLEQRVGQLENNHGELTKRVTSTDTFRARTEAEIDHFKRQQRELSQEVREKSSPDLSRFSPRKEPT